MSQPNRKPRLSRILPEDLGWIDLIQYADRRLPILEDRAWFRTEFGEDGDERFARWIEHASGRKRLPTAERLTQIKIEYAFARATIKYIDLERLLKETTDEQEAEDIRRDMGLLLLPFKAHYRFLSDRKTVSKGKALVRKLDQAVHWSRRMLAFHLRIHKKNM